MLKTIFKRILPLACACTMLFTTAWGYNYLINEDFENFTDAGWTWKGVGTLTDANGNKYQYTNGTGKSSYLGVQSTESPADYYIASVDFMIPSDGGASKVKILDTTFQNGKGEMFALWYADGALRIGASQDIKGEVPALATGLEKDRWYNVVLSVDISDKTTKPKGIVYFGDIEPKAMTAEHGFDNNERGYIGRWFMAGSKKGLTGKCGFDNVRYIATTAEQRATDVALAVARSKAVNAKEGYADGLYLPGSKAAFMEAYEEIVAGIVGQTLDATAQEAVMADLNAALAAFDARKIDATNFDPTPVFVKIGDSMPTFVSVPPDAPYTLNLDAMVGTISGNAAAGSEITWTDDTDSDKVSIAGNVLTIQPGFEGALTLTATSGDLSAQHKMDVVSERAITISEIKAEDTTFMVKGSFSGDVESDANISVTGDIDISLSGTFTSAADNTFTYTTTIPEGKNTQKLTIKITQAESKEKTVDAYFYGYDWKEAVLAEVVNAGTSVDMDDILALHKAKLTAMDTDTFNNATAAYSTRIFNGIPYYNDVATFEAKLAEANLMIGFDGVTRAEVQDLITTYSSVLTGNGFDPAEISKLGNGLDATFYLNAANIQIDGVNDTVATLRTKLSDIMTALKETDANVGSDGGVGGGAISKPSGGSGGGGGAGGSAGTSVGVGVTLVGGTTTTEPGTGSTAEVEGFADVSKTDWSYKALTFMRQKGIMEGDGKNVRPKDQVTRGEFAKIIVTAFDFKDGGNAAGFTDGAGAWWDSYAKIAAANNIVNGLGDGNFGGNDVINREQLAVMIDRAVKAKGYDLYDNNEGVSFDDASYISDYAKESISYLAKKGIISGIGDGLYAPGLSVTREEAAQIVYNVLNKL